jgi:hypothetical protein
MRVPAAILAVAILAVAPAAAEAKLPSPKSKVIVPNKSIAGVRIGMDAAQAVKLWGAGSNCDAAVSNACIWTAKLGTARFDVSGGKVAAIHIEAGQKESGESIYRGPLTGWKTKKKVGLGTQLNVVARKYKKAKATGGGLQIDGKRLATYFDSSGGRVARLSVAPRQ